MNEGLAAADFRRTTSSSHELDSEYADALKAHLRDPSEGTLRRGYELGRKAFADGTGILDMAAIHHATLRKVLRQVQRGDMGMLQSSQRKMLCAGAGRQLQHQ